MERFGDRTRDMDNFSHKHPFDDRRPLGAPTLFG